MPTWTPVTTVNDSFNYRKLQNGSNFETMDEQKRRRRRRPGDSAPGSPLMNCEAHTEADLGSSAPLDAVLTPSEQHCAPLAPLSLLTVDHTHAPTSRSPAGSTGPSPRFSPSTARHTGKRRASGEMIQHEEETKTTQPATPREENEIRRPDLPERAVVSPLAVNANHQAKPEAQQLTSTGVEVHTSNLHLRVSTRRTTTTTRWSPSMAGGRESLKPGAPRSSKAAAQRSRISAASAGSTVAPPTRPISNATKNITFDMLQPHFERPLQQAADSFGVCTTLLKKICRRNGISNWPYRKICGLRKSIASMAKQVNYFDGEQKRAYADHLEKLEHELQAFLRTGNEATDEFLQTLKTEALAREGKRDQNSVPTTEIGNNEEEKEAHEVPTWTTRPGIAQPQYSNAKIAHATHELETTPRRAPDATFGGNTWHPHPHGPPLQMLLFPTIATHHRALPPIASILQHQSYSSPSRAASTQDPPATSTASHYEAGPQQPTQWRYFPPTNDDAV